MHRAPAVAEYAKCVFSTCLLLRDWQHFYELNRLNVSDSAHAVASSQVCVTDVCVHSGALTAVLQF
jgi:hypothetical protein